MNSLARMFVTARTLRAGVLGASLLAGLAAPAVAQTYSNVDLVTNVCCGPERFDRNLNGAWGIAMGAAGPAWVVSTLGGRSTLYDGTGVLQTLVVRTETPAGFTGSSPAGIVSNAGSKFVVTDQSGQTGPARFIFATREGTIAAWKPPAAGQVANTIAKIVVDHTDGGGPNPSRYTGLAIGPGGAEDVLFAADFAHGRIDTFDGSFAPVAAAFQDPRPDGYLPFNVRVLNNKVYVAMAVPAAGHFDAAPGAGKGAIDVYKLDGSFEKRLVTGGVLNAPWGMAIAPANFGPLSNTLLVANTGDGRINGFKADSGELIGTLMGASGPIVIDGVHGLQFGNGTLGQATSTLYYAAAPTFAAVGVYGRIDLGAPFQIPPACAGDFNHDGRVSTQDIFDFLSSWFAGNLAADTNRSGELDVQDVMDFLGAWFAACV